MLAVTRHDRRLILVRRANPPDAGLWGFPGGRIEHGETMFEAAERELREETGVVARATKVLCVLDAIGPGEHHFVLIAVLCQWLDLQPVAADDALEARWFDLAAIDEIAAATSKGVVGVAVAALETVMPESEP